MTRVDGKGGSRIVPCPECGAKVGERCWDGSRHRPRSRVMSHLVRVGRAQELIEKRERKKRMTQEETVGAVRMREAIAALTLISRADFAEFSGGNIARDVALAAIDKLIRTRGGR